MLSAPFCKPLRAASIATVTNVLVCNAPCKYCRAYDKLVETRNVQMLDRGEAPVTLNCLFIRAIHLIGIAPTVQAAANAQAFHHDDDTWSSRSYDQCTRPTGPAKASYTKGSSPRNGGWVRITLVFTV
jgi:hypothetical protein